MGSVLDIVLGALGGGVSMKIIDHFVKFRRYAIDNDGVVSKQWKDLYDELRKVQKEQALKIDQLEIECEKLRLTNIDLQHQIRFNPKL